MTKEKLEFVNKLKEKVAEINKLVSEINKDKENSLRISIYQENWSAIMNKESVRNAVKFVSIQVTETFSY